eukprot:Gb_29558 [translate_table: standard]
MVWPAIQPGAGHPVLEKGGMCLAPGQSKSFSAAPGWSGRFWGRHGCSFDTDGKGSCSTGDCGGFYCNGAGGAPPATLVEITLGSPSQSESPSQQDFYDVSLVDGYNLPISICPRGGSGNCGFAGCVTDLNESCPPGLQVKSSEGRVVACKSACFAFKSPEYCCTGTYANPNTCKASLYSRAFKSACPRAYSYAFDDPTSLLTCSGADYVVTFCPH